MDRYKGLYSPFKELLLSFEEKFKKKTDIPIFLYCGFRSFEEQQRLYNIGRTTHLERKKVTNIFQETF